MEKGASSSDITDGDEERNDNGSSDEDNEVMDVFDEDVNNMERLNFDFEAFPPDESDLEGVMDLLTQIFLRVNVNCEELARSVIGLSPFGCIFKPAEENEDEDVGSLVYGIVSMVNLLQEEKCFREIHELLLHRASKHAEKLVVKTLTDVFAGAEGKRVGFFVNERMIHFPPQIAGPAFRSLREDLSKMSKKRQYDYVLVIVKIRVEDPKSSRDAGESAVSSKKGKGKKLGKAAKKRIAATKLVNSDVIYDNAEEELLFQAVSTPFINFQYPVESDVERTSKFHATIRNNVVYRPYRRVCLLSAQQFAEFSQHVENAFSA